ncbi:hypothetical protein GCM10011354_09030 [Egicoccus halophilus]|uniref:Uncharacterized protein n=1 Tax=Egicoccus halophilus TaxID=1670830 RepID=A0A8J3ESX6_9ACTN|nr:hypothetical protein GCM10011354_09030 [Egicoccus halophilus]
MNADERRPWERSDGARRLGVTTGGGAKRERTGSVALVWSMSLADDETYDASGVFRARYGPVGCP